MKRNIAFVLAALAVAAVAHQSLGPKDSDLRSRSMSNAKQLALGMLMYISDYDDVFPFVQDTKAAFVVTYPYMKNLEATKTLNPKGGQFVFNRNIGGVNATKIKEPALTPMYHETQYWTDDRRIVAYTDGHVKAVAKTEWNKVQTFLDMKFPREAKKPLPSGDKLAKEMRIKF